jgi:hypothetical protein
MGLFSKKTIQPTQMDNRNPQRLAIDNFLANYVSTYGSQYQPGKAYSGQFTAPLSGYEQQGLNQFLPQYLNSPDVSSQTGDVRSMLNKTITGGYDPRQDPYYAASRDAMNYNQGQSIRDLNASTGAAGQFFSVNRQNKIGDITAQTGIGLNKVIADLVNNERNRQMSAVNPSLALEQSIQQRPLQKAGAAMTYGAIPRELDQANLEAMYQDFKRQQTELSGVIGAGSGVSNTAMENYYPKQSKSMFEQISPLIMQGLGMFI